MLDKTGFLPHRAIERQPENIPPEILPYLVSGRAVAHGKRTVAQKALLGADLHTNAARLVAPTLRQCAGIVGVCVPYIKIGVAIADDMTARAAIAAGDISIRDITNAFAQPHELLADHILRCSQDELLDAARAVGVTTVWGCMVEPLI